MQRLYAHAGPSVTFEVRFARLQKGGESLLEDIPNEAIIDVGVPMDQGISEGDDPLMLVNRGRRGRILIGEPLKSSRLFVAWRMS